MKAFISRSSRIAIFEICCWMRMRPLKWWPIWGWIAIDKTSYYEWSRGTSTAVILRWLISHLTHVLFTSVLIHALLFPFLPPLHLRPFLFSSSTLSSALLYCDYSSLSFEDLLSTDSWSPSAPPLLRNKHTMADNWNTDNRYNEEEDEGVISQEDCWSVIQSYFDENVSLLFMQS